MTRRTHLSNYAQRAVTLTELLVVLVIVSIMATIAVPVAVNKAHQARITVAQQEVREIGQAMEQCGTIHGFYVPIHLLDNINDAAAIGRDNDAPADSLDNEARSSTYLIDPLSNLSTQTQLSLAAGYPGFGATPNKRIIDLVDTWAGPFINFQRVWLDEDVSNPDTGAGIETILRRDWPLDPWGQPYRFYGPTGLLGGDDAKDTDPDSWRTDLNAFTGELPHSRGVDAHDLDAQKDFDRFAIVSYGPDNEKDPPGDNTPDDINYRFGGAFASGSFKAFYH
jgi:prepilin-type N-terminal cleavage/methylation domain-containing protein